MAGKPTDVIEDWTYGPVRWIGAGLVMGAAAVGIAWSISARRVPVAIPVQAATKSIESPVNQVTPQAATLAPVQPPKPIVTELPPREAPAQVAAINDQPSAVEPIATAGLINVNTATTQQLETLPGIGPGLAAKIIDDRSKNGRFRSLADLDRVPGIGPKLLERMRPLVAFE